MPGHVTNEKVLIFSRRHPVSFIGQIAFLTFLFLLPFIVIPFWFGDIKIQLIIILACIYYLLWLDIAFIEWVKFHYNSLIVTDQQLIFIEQKGVFDRAVYQCHISQVQEADAKIKGLLPHLFSYGTITMQTAGPHENIFIENVPTPFLISERIMKLHNETTHNR